MEIIWLLSSSLLSFFSWIIFNRLHTIKKISIISAILILIPIIYYAGNELYAFIYILVMFVGLFVYAVIAGAKVIKQEKQLFTSIESKLRFDQDVIRIEQEDALNTFCRCMITKPDNQVKPDKSILIMPFLPQQYPPPFESTQYPLYFIDYNGNCIDSFGRYDEIGYLSNYAPYNELADALAKEGYLVVRLDMLYTEKKQVCIAGCLEDIEKWMKKIHEQYAITHAPIVIGHRENGILALELMKRNVWRKGVFLCCGLNYYYSLEKKSCYYYFKQLTKEFHILQIDAGIEKFATKSKKEKAEDLECDYKMIKMNEMDYSLRKIDKKHKGEVTDKGYKIICGTGEYPPIDDELVKTVVDYLSEE